MQVDHVAKRMFKSARDLGARLQKGAILARALRFDREVESPVIGMGLDDVLRLQRDRVTLSGSHAREDVFANPRQFASIAEPCPGEDEPVFVGAETASRSGRHADSLPSNAL